MQDTIVVGDHVVVDKSAYCIRNPLTGSLLATFGAPQRGDIITFKAPKEPATIYMHRVIGVAGDKVETKGAQLYLNDKLVTESYAKYAADVQPLDDFGPQIVPENQVFAFGDNRNNSLDSRFWGGVPLANVTGKAKGIYWSKDEKSGEIRWERIGKPLQ